MPAHMGAWPQDWETSTTEALNVIQFDFYCPTAASYQSSVIFEAAQTRREVSQRLTDAICYDSAFKCSPHHKHLQQGPFS